MGSTPINDPWVDAKWIMQKYTVSYRTARRWIMKLLGDDVAMLDKRRKKGKRPYRMRRIALSILEEHVDELLNH